MKNPTKINTYVHFTTTGGDFVIGLYEGTPLHKDNFIQNVSNKTYDSTLVYSVISNGLIRMGLPENTNEDDFLKENFNSASIQEEINPKLINKTAAVGMLRLSNSGNPEKFSDSQLFYLVEGIKTDAKTLKTMEAKRNAPMISDYMTVYLNLPENKVYKDSLDHYKIERKNTEWSRLYAELSKNIIPKIEMDGKELFEMTDYQIEVYSQIGGAPVYDGQYTIFGEIVYGNEILTKLTGFKTNLYNQPKENIYILSARILTKKEFKTL
jgi:cyclophilin family peptidyl-prolyl cis-trans isomerase